MKNIKSYLLLHCVLLLYSFVAIFSKFASEYPFLSFRFILYYGIAVSGLFVYAVLWQQVLKKLPLTVAFANKAIVVVWGMIWGNLIFQEAITIKKMIGVIVIFAGIYLVVTNDE